MNRIITGDCRAIMRDLIDQGVKVQMCVTSPPYWGLRDYQTEPLIIGGNPDCPHLWGEQITSGEGYSSGNKRKWQHQATRETDAENWQKETKQGAFCQHCNAWCGSLGLEPTPELYVEHIVEIFRLVRELLADDGTLWLNLGDSYATGTKADRQPSTGLLKHHTAQDIRRIGTPSGLKTKDLVGIPWRVAFALQQPYYTGQIKDERNRVWLAAIIDGEGCFFIHKRKAGTPAYSSFIKADGSESNYERTADTYGVGLEICNTSKAIIDRVAAVVGCGTFTTQGPEQNGRRKQTIYRWRVAPNEAKRIAQEVYPYLVAKQHQARLLFGCPSNGDAGAAAHQAIMDLHNGVETSIDYPAPPSMFEPGWYLRQDVIWSKKNPMPESVTDRCTKSHEYLFILAKAQKYYYDAEAIKETASGYDGRKDTVMKGSAKYANGFVPGQAPNTMQVVGHERWQKRKNDGTNYGGDGTGFQDHSGYSNLENPYVRNKRSVWTVATQPYADAHFATFPPALIEPCILAGSRPGDIVFDPFMGSGTTAQVAEKLGRKWLGCELNPKYELFWRERTKQTAMQL